MNRVELSKKGYKKMRKVSKRGEAIRSFIIKSIPLHRQDVVSVACRKFGITRQAMNRYIKQLVDDGQIEAKGNTSQREYSLKTLCHETFTFPLAQLQEDIVWQKYLQNLLMECSDNVAEIWQYAVSEIINNAIDHSNGTIVNITVKINAFETEILISDDGIGIFRKIKEEFHLENESHAVLELAKGKLTTDPARHTGEGIFFTSRVLDDFAVLSGEVYFSHKFDEQEEWISEVEKSIKGTAVSMFIKNKSDRVLKDVFDNFAPSSGEYGFNKTVVPVRLVRQGAEHLVSRSQAKRLLSRVDRFSIVVFDFAAVDSIGQAFADEIFRVFQKSHPHIRLFTLNTSKAVEQMIRRAKAL